MTSTIMDGIDIPIGRLHLCGRKNVTYKVTMSEDCWGTFCFALLLPTQMVITCAFSFNVPQPDYFLAKIAQDNRNSVSYGGR